MIDFHKLGPLGRVGHRLAMSVHLCVFLIVNNVQSIRFFVVIFFMKKSE